MARYTKTVRIWILLFCGVAGLYAESSAGLKWTAPAGWSNQGSRPMRAATYTVPATSGDHDPGECAVYFFGAGQGGGVEANIARWKGQFTNSGSTPPRKRTIQRAYGDHRRF